MGKPFKQYEIRRVPRIVIQGGDAIAQQCLGKWVHYCIGDGRRGKMLKVEWEKLRKVNQRN